mmetsp:Transcript_29737/g.86651  ORF Transcript_29737/g.86651 Transcript_29737/m.86651 type:complete len:400 (-) Transcript_29737:757-1956(-)
MRAEQFLLIHGGEDRIQGRLGGRSSAPFLPGLDVPLFEGLVSGAAEQIFAEGEGSEQHGVQDDARAPHIRLAAIVPLHLVCAIRRGIPALLWTVLLLPVRRGLRNNLRSHVVRTANDGCHPTERLWLVGFVRVAGEAGAETDDIFRASTRQERHCSLAESLERRGDGTGLRFDSIAILGPGRADAGRSRRCNCSHLRHQIKVDGMQSIHVCIEVEGGREAKVRNLERLATSSVVVNEEILRLQIPVRNAVLVTIGNARCQLLEELEHPSLRIIVRVTNFGTLLVLALSSLTANQVEQLPSPNKLENEEHGRLGILNELQNLVQMHDVAVASNLHHMANLLGGGAALTEPAQVLRRDGGAGNVGIQWCAVDGYPRGGHGTGKARLRFGLAEHILAKLDRS